MPYNYTHALLGELARQAVGEKAKRTIENSLDAFRIGTMGPDPYYGDAYPPNLFRRSYAPLADRLHGEDGGKLFDSLFTAAPEDAQRAYLMGFLCHFLLDNRAHPYIEGRFPGPAHTPAEIGMDIPMLKLYGRTNLCLPPNRLYSYGPLQKIGELHESVFRSLYGMEIHDAYAASYYKWIRLNRLSFDPDGRKARLLKPFPWISRYLVTIKVADADFMNLGKTVWYSPSQPNRPRRESFPELFDCALREAVSLLNDAAEAFQSGDASQVTGRLNGRCMDAGTGI